MCGPIALLQVHRCINCSIPGGPIALLQVDQGDVCGDQDDLLFTINGPTSREGYSRPSGLSPHSVQSPGALMLEKGQRCFGLVPLQSSHCIQMTLDDASS